MKLKTALLLNAFVIIAGGLQMVTYGEKDNLRMHMLLFVWVYIIHKICMIHMLIDLSTKVVSAAVQSSAIYQSPY